MIFRKSLGWLAIFESNRAARNVLLPVLVIVIVIVIVIMLVIMLVIVRTDKARERLITVSSTSRTP
jgi:hypothetical protein